MKNQIKREIQYSVERFMNSQEWNYEDEWFEETNVATKIRDYLVDTGYSIQKFNDDKTTKGHDIVAIKDGKTLVVEVKGFPSDKYVNGKNKGQKKRTHPNLQSKHWFSEALTALLTAKSLDWEVTIAMGLPHHDKYLETIEKLRAINEKIGIIYFIVHKDGCVRKIPHVF
jgi:hypothetical protein